IELYDGTTKVWGTAPGTQASQPPSAPTNLTAGGVTQNSATLSWTAAVAGSNPVAGYTVFTGSGIQVGTSTTTSFALAGLTAGTTNSYYVMANDSTGTVSAPSATVSFTTPGGTGVTPPGAPGTPTATNITPSGTTLAWAAASAGSN